MVEKIKITFLGTGSAIPTARRNHPATLVQYKAENILVDCGEGTQRQFRKAKLNPCKITKILISHWHGDHVLGLPGLLMTMMLNGYNKNLEIYGPRGTREKIRQYFDLIGRKGQELDVKIIEVRGGVVFDNDEFFIEALEMDHDAPAVAYSFIVKEKNRLDKEKLKKLKIPNSPLVGELVRGKTIEINGKKIDGKKLMYKQDARKVTFIMDTRMNNNAVKISKGANVLISEATHSIDEQEVATEYGHLTSKNAATIAKRAKVKALVLVHLSQRYDAIPKVILKEAKETFSDVIIPEDLEGIEL
jgi:ribonuclease Z